MDTYTKENAKLHYEQFLKLSSGSNYVERLFFEIVELEDRITKLEAFVNTNDFRNMTNDQVELMKTQLNIMKAYLFILNQRIK